MKKDGEVIAAIASANPKISIGSVQPDGDVAFHVKLKDCSLTSEDCLNRIMRTKFFANFIGELLVRNRIKSFAKILTGLDSALYQKMVGSSRHTDFGMTVDNKRSTLTFQMHISLVQEIMTEDFSRESDFIEPDPEDDQSFELCAPDEDLPQK